MAYEQFIDGTKHKKVQERLLEKSKLTLSKTINITRTYEASVSQMEQGGQGFAAPEPKEEHEAGKETEKTIGCIITPGARIDAAVKDPQVENVDMAIKKNNWMWQNADTLF